MDFRNKYNGVIVPMVTPVLSSGEIDEIAVKTIIDSFIQAGVVPFILGSTGEASSLSSQQKKKMVAVSVKFLRGRSLLYVGISGNCLSETIEEGNVYADMGADVLVSTPPSYYPMTGYQMINYFNVLADALLKPLIIYNMPSMTKHNIPISVVEELSQHKNIVGLKDSERDEDRLMLLVEKLKERTDFVYLLGWAALSVKALTHGASGIVPSTANLTPELYRELFDFTKSNNLRNAERLQHTTNYISGLYQNGRVLSESIPALKALMSLKGLCGLDVIPPMYRMKPKEEDEYLKQMRVKLKQTNVL
ncbi:MAG TPA: dihydrodipicolinate synthase family protein [Marinilabiliaceae bacterium]|nr:dihydrodipicolinate synthase family protein [Marinilabiliaceae bacterium]